LPLTAGVFPIAVFRKNPTLTKSQRNNKEVKMKKILTSVLVLLMTIVMLAACAPAAAPVETPAKEGAAKTEEPAKEEVKEEPEVSEEAAAPVDGAWPEFKEKIYLGVAIRSLSNPYHAKVKEGAEALAADLKKAGYDVEVTTLACEGSDEEQVNQVKALIARGGKNTVFYVDPNNSTNAPVIAEVCEAAGVYWASVWNCPEDVFPMDYKYWVAHNSPDDVLAGYEIAVDIFNRFETPGTGKILALEGMLGNSASSNRTAGLKKALAEYPDIEVLDMQPTDWDMTKSLNITETWLSKYTDFDGIWTSGDPMGIGALTALKNGGYKPGDIKVTGVNGTQEAIDSVLAGELTNTWDVGGFTQGYYVSAWAIAALVGKIDVESLPVSSRMFLTPGQLINPENVADAGKAPVVNYLDFEKFNIGAMPNNWKE
jgi:ABC-type sugar transport system substrate-binding protein